MESGMRKDNKQKIKLLQLHEMLHPESMVKECRKRVRELGESYGS